MNANANQPERLFSVLVRREPEIMSRLTGLLRRRGYVTLGISAGRALERESLRLTLQIRGDQRCAEQVPKQIRKITESAEVTAIDPRHNVRREMALIKIRCREGAHDGLRSLAGEFRGRVVSRGPDGLIVEMTAEPQAIDRFIARLDVGDIVDIARSGVVAMDAAAGRALDPIVPDSTGG